MLAEQYFRPVRFPDANAERLRELSASGFVVHVMRSTSWVNYLYLNWALIQRALPPVRAVVNLRPWFTRPFRLAAQGGEPEVRFDYAERQGGSGLIFLKKTGFLRAGGRDIKEDPFTALVKMARKSDRPVWLVPELFVWEKKTAKLKPSWMDHVFGSPEAPGFIHSLVAYWRNYQRAQFRVGEPIDLRRFAEENPDDPDERLGRKVRSALHHHLARESRAVFGPPVKHPARIIEETMRDPVLRNTMGTYEVETGRSASSTQREVRRNLRSIAAKISPTVLSMVSPILSVVFERIYDGIEVDERGLERAMQAGRQTPLVLTPSHKSHVDYLVLAWVLWRRGYNVPTVAAGANLSFFPLGPLLRRCGAFFLRRSFKGDVLYTASFRAYVKKLVRDGTTQEFFLEGGRSRTGKLLQPKLGLLTWEVDAVLEGARDDVSFVPVSIDYERVMEGGSYSHELAGGEKKPEDLKALLKTPKVLTQRYGRVYLTFDAPIRLTEVAQARQVPLSDEITEDQKRGLVRALGHRLMYGVSRVSTVTPHALVSAALLAHRQRGLSGPELSWRISVLRRIASEEGTPLSLSLQNAPSDPTVMGAVQDAVRTLTSDGMVATESARNTVIFRAVDDRRAELSFYKNTLMNMVASRALLATALFVARNEDVTSLETVKAFTLNLSRLFKVEFIYRADQGFDEIFAHTLERLERMGLVEHEGDTVRIGRGGHAIEELSFLADLVRDYVESYLLALLTLEDVARAPNGLDKKEFVRAALDNGRLEFHAGRLQTPEALSRTTLENAISWLKDQGFLVEENRRLKAGGLADEAEERQTVVQRLRRCLMR
ncbi:MAG TPA: 1-acyl-sn-glycerol-3-phosphate acyltransferase [Myxococcaceae bacterium]|nr:1-acyl-sn-glycerol-3-phosphate acyltransferase [Myxococcaceae bacterium]